MARVSRSLLAAILLVLSFAPPASAKTHEVVAGDSLWSLAKKYGVSMKAIQEKNGLKRETVRLGERLEIPEVKGSEPPKDDAKATPKDEAPKPAEPAKAAEPKLITVSTEPTPEPEPEAPPTPIKLDPPTRAQRAAAEKLYSDPERSAAPSTMVEKAPDWVLARPAPSTQVQKSNAARGGVYPCATPDPGFGEYSKWQQVAPMAHVLVPKQIQLDAEGGFDVLFHFHGREPVRKEWVTAIENTVLIAVDVGIASSAYSEAFKDPRTFGEVLRATEAEVAKRTERDQTHVRHVGVSAWSAGYGAVQQLLDQPYPLEVIDTVVLLDGLHSGYVNHSLDAVKLAPFVRFAQRAVKQETFMFVSHSSILTEGYATTTETAQYLVWKVGGKPQYGSSAVSDPLGLERLSWYSSGNFHVRGFKGNAAADHCAQLGLMRDILRVHVAPRWKRSVEVPAAPTPEPAAPTPATPGPVAVLEKQL